ncbi:DnaJ domain-containing protein [Saccharibacillus sacchari]|uniref:DnaJ-class molecular chaperone with C-terminal Zn finger domain n=1 Tax=Saccharibacillus sacchari DSM 19268 TaxID=915437 RepID=A0A011A193_9BACL|nr:DnaJ domain-containing protein [Saccharibacillus sacchari]EXG83282.1 DnaJ-class molecular chaperone with C-terminal Zn finger domain [Saccharibacillus sacchari DSM 19268]
MPDKNYYDVLGVDANASQSEIKKAYQKLAKQWHPDVNKAEGAEARFKEIAAAYEILGSEEKRGDYDASRRRSASGFGGAARGRSSGSQEPEFGSGGSNFDWINDLQHEDIFDMFFNERMGGMGGIPGGFGSATAEAGPRRPAQSTLEVTLEQAYKGETVRIELGGKKIGLRLPERSRNGQTVRMTGNGSNGLAVGEELLIVLKIVEHAVYSLEEEDLIAALRIAPWQAALGGQARIVLPDGAAVNMNIPRGIAARRRLRIPRRGLKKSDGTYGDFFAEIEIAIPDPSKEEEELYRRLEAFSKFNPQLAKRKS